MRFAGYFDDTEDTGLPLCGVAAGEDGAVCLAGQPPAGLVARGQIHY